MAPERARTARAICGGSRAASARETQGGESAQAEAAPATPDAPEAVTFTSGGTKDKVMKLLQAKPMGSGDLIKASGLTSPMVYTALTTMRKAGQVETKEDPTDGMRKNYWVG